MGKPLPGLDVPIAGELLASQTWYEYFQGSAIRNFREILTANRDYYVAITGSDSNSGRTASAPFLTMQKAIDIAAAIDGGLYNMTINVADGTYTAEAVLKSYVGAGAWTIKGNSTTPANCIISLSSVGGFCVRLENVIGRWIVDGFTLVSTNVGVGLYVSGTPSNLGFKNIVFGNCATHQIDVVSQAYCEALTDYSVTGDAGTHLTVRDGGVLNTNFRTVTITGTPTIGTWARSVDGNAAISLMTFVGAPAVGCQKYDVTANGVVQSSATLPGSVAGTTASGGQYI